MRSSERLTAWQVGNRMVGSGWIFALLMLAGMLAAIWLKDGRYAGTGALLLVPAAVVVGAGAAIRDGAECVEGGWPTYHTRCRRRFPYCAAAGAALGTLAMVCWIAAIWFVPGWQMGTTGALVAVLAVGTFLFGVKMDD